MQFSYTYIPTKFDLVFLLVTAFVLLKLVASNKIEQSEYSSDENVASFLKKDYCLSKPYQGHWDFSGSTVITPDFVRLTPNSQSHKGAIWCLLPVKMRYWEVQLNFKVHGTTGNLYGDGLAFWYVDPEATKFEGPVFGVQDRFRGLAVLLDTYSNHNGPHSHDHPYISAIVNNGSLSYDHDRDGTHFQLSGCVSKFRNRNYDTLLSVRYVDNVLLVSTNIENQGHWEVCLRVPKVLLPTHYVFGVTAMTGDLSDHHDLMSIKVYEIESSDPSVNHPSVDYRKLVPFADTAEPERPHVSIPVESGWSLLRVFLAVIFSLSCLVVLTVLVCAFYSRQQKFKKRFY